MFFGFGLAGATGFPVDLGTNEGFEAELDLATTGFEVGLGAAGDGFESGSLSGISCTSSSTNSIQNSFTSKSS